MIVMKRINNLRKVGLFTNFDGNNVFFLILPFFPSVIFVKKNIIEISLNIIARFSYIKDTAHPNKPLDLLIEKHPAIASIIRIYSIKKQKR